MRTFLTLSTAAAALLTAMPALAQQTTAEKSDRLPGVTVVATRTETPVNQVAATVSVYTDEDIERMLFTEIKDLGPLRAGRQRRLAASVPPGTRSSSPTTASVWRKRPRTAPPPVRR